MDCFLLSVLYEQLFVQAMESKLLCGGKNIVDHTNEQQRALEQRRQEIAEQQVCCSSCFVIVVWACNEHVTACSNGPPVGTSCVVQYYNHDHLILGTAERKRNSIYIAPFVVLILAKCSDSFTCKLHHARLVHQMAPPLTEVADIQLQLTTHLSTSRGWKAELAWLVGL